MRQPSAEDLDAAHQLVSSARGERSSSHVVQEGQSVENGEPKSQDPIVAESKDVDNQRHSSHVSEREDYSGLGQICRYV